MTVTESADAAALQWPETRTSSVAFLSVAGAATWIRRTGPEQVIAALVERLEADFTRWEDFDRTARVAAHSPEGVIELMPTSDGVTYGFKYVNGHPGNPARGYQTVTAFGVLAEVHNGYPVFLSEMTLLTALRTAATSAMAARHLARADSRSMAMIGTGSQAEFQALGFRAVLGITALRIWDTDPAAMAKFARNVRALGFDVVLASDAADAVRGADIVTTCTADKANATILTDAMIEPGVHLNAIGGDCPGKTELEARILGRADVFVEYTPQTRIEGEIQQVDADFGVTELWQVIAGHRPGRTSADQITLFDSVGFAIEDFTVLRFVFDAVRHSEHVSYLDAIADPDDPKDLFQLVAPV